MALRRAALVGGNLSDSACLSLNNDHLSSLTVLIVPFGCYSWQTNCSIPSRVSLSGFSPLPRLAKDLRIGSLASSNFFPASRFPFFLRNYLCYQSLLRHGMLVVRLPWLIRVLLQLVATFIIR